MGSTRASRKNQARGITFLEIILALALLGVLMAYAMPALTGTVRGTGLPESAERLRSLIHLTRAAAMRDGVKYRLAFPGAPDPNDPNAERLVQQAMEQQQPFVEREADPLNNPGVFTGVDLYYDVGHILMQEVRCVAVRLGQPSFDINNQSPLAGPEVNAPEAPMDRVTFNPDGTCDWVTFTLTNIGFDVEPDETDVPCILNVMLDGRTGQTWFQRPWRNTEVELMNEYGASPLLHVDFVKPDEITEENILHIRMQVEMATGG